MLLGGFRTLYAAYAMWCWLFPLVLLGLAWALLGDFSASHASLKIWVWAGLPVVVLAALYAVVYTYRQRDATDPNPWQSGFMAWFGTLKLFRNTGGAAAVRLFWPSSYLVENPRGYRISGKDLRVILNLLQPGDLLLRGYEGYLDGEFIRRSSLTRQNSFQPGWFTHVALYVGDLTESDRVQVPPAFRDPSDHGLVGPQRVIHAMAQGVHTEDILTFLRCDYLAVLRLPAQLGLSGTQASEILPRCRQASPPSVSDAMVTAIQDDLQAGKTIDRQRVIAAAHQSALEKIGEAYDFDCSDTSQFNRFSCAELLYYCLRGVVGALQLKPQPHALYPFATVFPKLQLLERVTITPDDYADLISSGHLTCIWEDATSQTRPRH